jgi:histidinol-phosphate aminotransferase
MRTFSKAQGLSALRIGYGITSAEVAGLLNRSRQPFNANAIAQAGALAAIQDEEHIAATVKNNAVGLRLFEETFADHGWEFVPSHANFVLVKVGDGDAVFGALLKKGIIVRAMRGYKLPEWVRISIGTPEQNQRCLDELSKLLAS